MKRLFLTLIALACAPVLLAQPIGDVFSGGNNILTGINTLTNPANLVGGDGSRLTGVVGGNGVNPLNGSSTNQYLTNATIVGGTVAANLTGSTNSSGQSFASLQAATNAAAGVNTTSNFNAVATMSLAGAASGNVPTYNGSTWGLATPSGGGSGISILGGVGTNTALYGLITYGTNEASGMLYIYANGTQRYTNSTTGYSSVSSNGVFQTFGGSGTSYLTNVVLLTLTNTAWSAGMLQISSAGGAYTASVLPASEFPALTGDITTSAGALATTLKATGTAGTYTKTTFDAEGRETSGAAAAPTDLSGWPANASGVLQNNGSGTLSWVAAGGGGTVTSVGFEADAASVVSWSSSGANPVTTSGNLTPTFSLASSSQFGVAKVDGTTITAASGVLTAVGGGGSQTPLTGNVNGAGYSETNLSNIVVFGSVQSGTNPAAIGTTNVGRMYAFQGLAKFGLGRRVTEWLPDGVANNGGAASYNLSHVGDYPNVMIASPPYLLPYATNQAALTCATAASAGSSNGIISAQAGIYPNRNVVMTARLSWNTNNDFCFFGAVNNKTAIQGYNAGYTFFGLRWNPSQGDTCWNLCSSVSGTAGTVACVGTMCARTNNVELTIVEDCANQRYVALINGVSSCTNTSNLPMSAPTQMLGVVAIGNLPGNTTACTMLCEGVRWEQDPPSFGSQ